MLYRKMWRDLKNNKIQFFAIFMMAYLAAYVFVGLDCEVTGFDRGIDRYYEETNLADLWVTGAVFTQRDVEKLVSYDEIQNAELRTQVKGYIELGGDIETEFNFIEGNEISSMKYVDGEKYVRGSYGIWVDYIFLEKNGLSIGDAVNLKIGSDNFTEVIRGTFRNPEYVYYLPDASAMMPDYGSYAFCFLSGSEYPSEEFAYTQLLVDLTEVDNSNGIDDDEAAVIRQMKDKIKDILENQDIVSTDKTQNLSYETFASEIKQHNTMAFAFPVVFMMIAVLGIITTMTRMTSNQRIQIGTLKALGFGRRAITFHYVTYGIILSLAGSIAGAAAGYYTIADIIISEMVDSYLTPYYSKIISSKSVLVIIISTVVAAFVSYASCRKILHENAATILKPAAPKLTKTSAFEKSRLWLSFDFSTQWNIRDIQRNMVRSVMGALGVAGCTMLLVCAFGCNDSMHYIFDWMYGKLITSNYKIIFESDASYGTVYDISRKYDGQMIEEAAIEISAGNVTKTGTLTAVDDGNYYHFHDISLNTQFLSKDGIAVSYKISQILGVGIGDYITWNIIGSDSIHVSRIEQIFRTPTGQGIAMRRDILEENEEKFMPTAVLTNVTVEASLNDNEYVSGIQSMEELRSGLETMTENMLIMIGMLIIAAVLLGVVVLYNMGVLSFIEKTREISTLKVLGFKSSVIRGILQKQNIWITLVGCAAGIPFGNAMLTMIFASMGDSMDYKAVVYPLSYVYSVIGTFIVSVAVNRILSRKVKTIDMVDALKGVE